MFETGVSAGQNDTSAPPEPTGTFIEDDSVVELVFVLDEYLADLQTG